MNKLKQLRKEADLTLRDLSKYVGIPNSVITYLESGTRPFRQVHIDKLTSFFNVTSDYLLGRSDYGYIVYPQYGSDEVILSDSEYNRLSDHITLSIINNKININVSIVDNKEETNINIPSHCVYRELKGELNDYDMKETLYLKLNELTKKMTESDLKKTIKFIEDYIFK